MSRRSPFASRVNRESRARLVECWACRGRRERISLLLCSPGPHGPPRLIARETSNRCLSPFAFRCWPSVRAIVARRLALVNVAFADEVGLPAEASAQAGIGKNGFQFGQNTSCAQFNELFSLLQPLHSIGPQWFEPCEQRAV